MKIAYFLLFLSVFVFPSSILAYSTNMSASVVVGQPNFTSGSANQGGSASSSSLKIPGTGLVINGKLIVVDSSNNRVLIWNSIPTTNGVAADVVIGQTNFTNTSSNQGGSAAANTLDAPNSLGTDGTKLIIADYNNARFLIYNTVPTSNNASANVVIGQPNMTTISCGTTASKFCGADMPWYDSATGKLILVDSGDHRVLIYNSVPTTNGASADVVLGQDTFTTFATGTSATRFNIPQAVLIANGKVVIADSNNNRVLIYNSIPTSNGAAADLVIGQTNFTNRLADQGGSAAANTLDYPTGLGFDGLNLFISDFLNNRIMIYSQVPTSNNASANAVIGQTDFSGQSANKGQASPSASSINSPVFGLLGTYNNQLFVGDAVNNRVLIFNDDSITPTPTATPLVTPTQTSTPSPTGAVTEHHSSFVPNPNKKENWTMEINAGPEYVGDVKPITEVSAPDASAHIVREALHDPIHLSIRIVHANDLSTVTPVPVPMPWNSGVNIFGDVYDFYALSAFNGFQILNSDSPYTITLPYDAARLGRMNPQNLRIAYYDRTTGTWKVLRNNTVLNWEKHTISNTTTLFTYFAVGYSTSRSTNVLGVQTNNNKATKLPTPTKGVPVGKK